MRRRKQKGSRRVSYELIRPDSVVGGPIHKLLAELVERHHEHLAKARIGLAWCTSWRPDRDGRVTLGKCKKASDLDRELATFDFIILLKKSWWQDARDMEIGGRTITATEQRTALLDHELCHAGVTYDDRTGDPVTDERGRIVYRIIKHDIEEFSPVVGRNGIWKRDLEQFAAALNRAARAPWQPCATCRDSSTPGWVEVEENGVTRMARCECLKTWQERRREAIPA